MTTPPRYKLLTLLVALNILAAPAYAAQKTERISLSATGEESASGGIKVCTNQCTTVYFHNQWPSISADGRYVAFYSAANNLVSGDSNSFTDIFVRDREKQTTFSITPNSNGNSSLPNMSQSGDFVSFRSEASNLTSSDSNGKSDVFVFSKDSGTLERVSISSNGAQANGDSYNSAITPDGRYVVFDSFASNLVSNDNNNTYDIFLRDRQTGKTERITGSKEPNGPSFDPSISTDGRYIAFYSFASNLVNNDTNNNSDIFIFDRHTNTMSLVSVGSNGEIGNAASVMPSMSNNGRVISFRSLASNLAKNDNNHAFDIFVRDLDAGHTQRVNVSNQGSQAISSSIFNAISGDGRRVVFDSYANNLVPGDSNSSSDIFVRDLSKGETHRVSISTDGAQANQGSSLPIISGDGRYVAFESFASNLIQGDHNGNKDIFVHDLGPSNQQPIADAGSDAVYECTGSSTLVSLNGSNSNDPDGDELSFNWSGFFGSSNQASLDFYMGLGTERFDLSVDDGQGGSASDSVYLTVTDSVAPHITMPSSIQLEAESASGTHYLLTPSYNETCGDAAVNVSPYLSSYPLGKTFVDVEVTDSSDNSSHHSVTINVVDTTSPTLTTPADINAEAGGPLTSLDIGSASAWDAVGVESLSNNAPASYPLGTSTVIWMASDAAGNTTTAKQLISIGDNTAPSLTAPEDITAEATAILTELELGTVTATDLVDGSINASHNAPQDGFPLGLTAVTWSAVDSSNNSSSAIQNVTIVDTTAPSLTLPLNMVVEATGRLTSVDIGTAVAADIFDVSVSSNQPEQFPLGDTVVTWNAEDINGNSNSGQQTITVQDTTAPTITVPADVNKEATAVLTPVNVGNATANDLVDGDVSTSNNAPAEGFAIGTTSVTWSAVDSHGNQATATQHVTINDTTAPLLTAPADVTVEAAGKLTTAAIGSATASDIFDVVVSNNAPAQFPLGDTVITWTAEDANGNTASSQQTVTVQDTTPPRLTVPGSQVVEANGVLSTVSLGVASAFDLVDGAVQASNNMSADGFPLGTTVVTWFAADSQGNVATAEQIITVVDTTKPLLTAPADITVTATGPLTTVELGTADTSDIFGAEATHNAPTQFNVGTTTVVWTAIDGNGNTSTAVQTVNVHYAFDGFKSPLKSGKLYRGERTIPVKVGVSYANGEFVGNANIQLSLFKVDDDGAAIAILSNGVFKAQENQYIFMLDTKSLESGTYLIHATPDDDSAGHSISIRYQEQSGKQENGKNKD